MILVIALLTGCVIEGHSAVSTGASLQGVVLEDAFGNRIEAEEASVDALGNGRGLSVHAELTVDEQGGPQNQPGLEPEMR